MNDVGGIVVFLVYVIAALFAAQFVAPWLAQSSILNRFAAGLTAAVVYAFKGLAAVAVLGVAAAPVWFIAQAEAGTRTLALEVVGYAIAALAALVVIGWAADRAVAKFIEAHPDYEEWGDLFGEDIVEPEASD